MAKPFCCGWKAGRHAKMRKSKNHVGAFSSEYTPKCEKEESAWARSEKQPRQNAKTKNRHGRDQKSNHAKMRKRRIGVGAIRKATTPKCEKEESAWARSEKQPRQNAKTKNWRGRDQKSRHAKIQNLRFHVSSFMFRSWLRLPAALHRRLEPVHR